MSPLILTALIAPSAILAITLHEAAHGYVARHFGDDTAMKRGRLTLNPLRHIDPVGTLLLPGALLLLHSGVVFGYAKPVPVNPMALFHPKRDMIWVAAAGPAMNVFLAAASFLLIFPAALLGQPAAHWAILFLWFAIINNVVLATLNLLPVPPLDGAKIAIGLLPPRLAVPFAKLQRFGLLLPIVIFVLLPELGHRVGMNLDVFGWMVSHLLHPIAETIQAVTPH